MPQPLGIPVQNGVPVALHPGIMYELRNYGNASSNTGKCDVTPTEKGRKVGLTFGAITISAGGKIRIDGDLYASIQGSEDNASTSLQLLPGLNGYDVPYVALAGSYLNYYSVGQTVYNPVRILELLGSIGAGSGSSSVALDESVASAGSGSGTLTSPTYMQTGQCLHIQWGISQDSLGTSPHGSYILVSGPQGETILKVRGAVNPYGKMSIRVNAHVSSSTPYTFSYENGDSVAHWFLLVATVI